MSTKRKTQSYWKVFRLIFMIFSLYLVGDAFYRWNGFRYYGSFLDFLPGVGLAVILWSIVALFVAVFVWFFLKIVEFLSRQVRSKMEIEHVLMFLGMFLLLCIAVMLFKAIKIHYLTRFIRLNLTSLLVISIAALLLTWIFRNKAESWLDAVQERITPLVWLFVFSFIISLPLVVYYNWFSGNDNIITKKVSGNTAVNVSRPNIVLLTFDALAARNMSLYKYELPTTPFMSEWAKSASLFTRLYAADNHTTPSIASLLTGKRVWTHRSYQQGSRPAHGAVENLPLQLKNNGYNNGISSE